MKKNLFLLFLVMVSCFSASRSYKKENISPEKRECNCEKRVDSGHSFVPYETPPKLIKYCKPKYPPEAKKKCIETTIWLKLFIDRDGNVCKVKAMRSPSIFQPYAVKAAYQCKFIPAKQNGKPVCIWIAKPFKFSLR